ERLAILVVVVDAVALDEADRPVAIADEEDPRRVVIVAADPAAVLLELVVGVGLARRVRPPTADVRLEEPLADAREVRLGQRREVVLRGTERGRAARGARASARVSRSSSSCCSARDYTRLCRLH